MHVYCKRLVNTCKWTSLRCGTTPTPETWFTWVACHDPPWRTGWHRQRGRLRLKYTRLAVVTEHRWSTLGWGRKLARRESQDKDRKSPNMRHTWGVFSKLGRKYITYAKQSPNTINATVIIYMCICNTVALAQNKHTMLICSSKWRNIMSSMFLYRWN